MSVRKIYDGGYVLVSSNETNGNYCLYKQNDHQRLLMMWNRQPTDSEVENEIRKNQEDWDAGASPNKR